MSDEYLHPAEDRVVGVTVSTVELPHSIEAEREVLAAVLVEPSAVSHVTTMPEWAWYALRHQLIAQAIRSLHARSVPVDPVTLQHEMAQLGLYERAGGARAIGELLDRSGTIANVGHYAAIVRDKALQRRIIEATRQVEVAASSGYDGAFDAALQELQRRQAERVEALRPQESWATACEANVVDAMPGAPPQRVVRTGLQPLDEHLPAGGLEAGWLCVVIAPPGTGKTLFSLGNVTRSVCEAGGSVLYVALSDAGVRRLNLRMLAGVSGVPERAAKRRDMTPWQISSWQQAADQVARWRLHVERIRSADDIAARARVIAQRQGLDLVVVDYIQRVRSGMRDRFADIEHATGTLQDLAVDLGVPVMALSQPSTAARREKKAITAADAKGSGAIEEDADLVLLLQRGAKRADGAIPAGLEILKGRDVEPRVWAVEEVVDAKTRQLIEPACGWRWDMRHMRMEAM
jgi:replicative DNA helicase